LTGTPVAGFIVLCPRIQVKAVEGDALLADGDLHEVRPHLRVEAIPVHAQIEGGIAQPDEPRQEPSAMIGG
jgi:hypothetical protein